MQTITLPKLYPLQSEIKGSFNKYRFVTVNAARRVGKSLLGTDLVITKALDTGYDTAYFSISYKQLTSMYDRACTILEPIARYDRQNKRILLPNGSTITYWSLENENTSDKVRGQRYAFVVIDEAAYVKALKDVFNKVIRPTLIDLKGQALFISTPNGYNDFYHLYQEAKRNPYLWHSFRATTYDNPFIDKDELDQLKEALPERVFRTEILAHFLESDQGVFTNLSALLQPTSNPSGICVFGIDLARSGDNTSITVMQGTSVIDLRVYKDMSFDRQIATIIELYQRYKPEVIVIEDNGLSAPIVEKLTGSNLPIEPFHTTNSSKKQIIENLAVAIEQGTISVDKTLDHSQQLVDELAVYESKKSSLGAITYNAPAGYNDDMVISLALAYKAVRQDDVPLVIWQ
jgi:hypothetical protein